jgi:hypothetical protein
MHRGAQAGAALPDGVDKAVSAVNMIADRLKSLDPSITSSTSWQALCAQLCTLFPQLFQKAAPTPPRSQGAHLLAAAGSPGGMLSPLSTAIKTADRMFSQEVRMRTLELVSIELFRLHSDALSSCHPLAPSCERSSEFGIS